MFILCFFAVFAVLINLANINTYLGNHKFCQPLHTFPANDKISYAHLHFFPFFKIDSLRYQIAPD